MHCAAHARAELGAEHVGQAVLCVYAKTMGHRKSKKAQVMELLLLIKLLPPQLEVMTLPALAILSVS